MAFFRQGEMANIIKRVPAGSATLVESDYSLIIKAQGLSNVVPANNITFTIVQPTSTTEGSISCSFMIEPYYNDGSHVFELHQIIPGGDTWTKKIGSARVKVEKVVTPVLYV